MNRFVEHLSPEATVYSTSARIASTRQNIVLVKEFMDRVRKHVHMSEDLFGNILIALIEAVNNGIIHGNRCDEKKFVDVKCDCYKDRVEMTVEDQGKGFNPAVIPNPTDEENLLKEGGRGVHIIRTLMDDVTFRHTRHGMQIHFISFRAKTHSS